MQDQCQRDAKSVTIATGLLLGVAVLLPGLLLLWIAAEVFSIPAVVTRSLTAAFEVAAVIVLVAYVARHRRP